MKKILIIIIFLLLNTKLYSYYYTDEYKDYDKIIKINTYYEILSYYEKWRKIWEFQISSWDANNQTPTWRFKVLNKSPMMLSKSAWKWMPYWMEFYKWMYGIHWLSLDKNLKQTKEENEVIWYPEQWWCVRVWKENIKKLYNWADYNTLVLIAYDKKEYENRQIKSNTNWENIIKTYYNFINKKEYKKAFDLKVKKNIVLETFISMYKWIIIKNIKINKKNNIEYEVISDILKDWKTIKSKIKSIFMIKNNKISNSYLIK